MEFESWHSYLIVEPNFYSNDHSLVFPNLLLMWSLIAHKVCPNTQSML